MIYSLDWCLAQILLTRRDCDRAKRNAYMVRWNAANKQRVCEQRKSRREGVSRDRILAGKKRHYEKHKASILAYQQKYRAEHPEKISARDAAYRARQDPVVLKRKKADEYLRHRPRYAASAARWRKENPNWASEWRQKNLEYVRSKQNEYTAARILIDPWYRAVRNYRSRLWALLTARRNAKSDILGLERDALRKHIEERFLPGMSWENYAVVWELDHIIPCSEFDLASPESILRCFAYANLRPLWCPDNRRKGAKILRQTELAFAPSSP